LLTKAYSTSNLELGPAGWTTLWPRFIPLSNHTSRRINLCADLSDGKVCRRKGTCGDVIFCHWRQPPPPWRPRAAGRPPRLARPRRRFTPESGSSRWGLRRRSRRPPPGAIPRRLRGLPRCRAVMELRMRFVPYLHAAFVRYRREGLPPFRALVEMGRRRQLRLSRALGRGAGAALRNHRLEAHRVKCGVQNAECGVRITLRTPHSALPTPHCC